MNRLHAQIANMLADTQAIVFDWHDTLIDAKNGEIDRLIDIAAICGTTRSPSEVMELYRKHPRSISDMLSELCQIEDAQIIQAIRSHNVGADKYSKRPIEGAEAAVRTLHDIGFRTTLLANVSADRLTLDSLGTGFDLSVFGEKPLFTPPQTPKYDPLAFGAVIEWLRNVDIEHDQAIYVGDGLGDMEGSSAAGLGFIGVEQGFITAEEFATRGALSIPGVQALADIAQGKIRTADSRPSNF